MLRLASSGGSAVNNLLANAGDTGLIPGSRGSPGGGNSNALQYSRVFSSTTVQKHQGFWFIHIIPRHLSCQPCTCSISGSISCFCRWWCNSTVKAFETKFCLANQQDAVCMMKASNIKGNGPCAKSWTTADYKWRGGFGKWFTCCIFPVRFLIWKISPAIYMLGRYTHITPVPTLVLGEKQQTTTSHHEVTEAFLHCCAQTF